MSLIILAATILGALGCIYGLTKAIDLFDKSRSEEGLGLLFASVSGIFAVIIVGLGETFGSPF